jgi:hypothetical protein
LAFIYVVSTLGCASCVFHLNSLKSQATMATPHLLNLPREIRNLIYDYLSHDVDDPTTLKFGQRFMNVSFKSIPDRGIMQVHSRLRHEFLEGGYLEQASAMLKHKSVLAGRKEMLENWQEPDRADFGAVRHVQLVPWCSTRNDWGSAEQLVQQVKGEFPQLQSLVFVITNGSYTSASEGLFRGHEVDPQALRVTCPSNFFIADPPRTLGGLQFVSGSQSLHIRFRRGPLASVDNKLPHQVARIGVFVYNVDGSAQDAPDPMKIPGLINMNAYPAEYLALCSAEKAAMLAELPFKLIRKMEMSADGYTMFNGVKTEVVEWPPVKEKREEEEVDPFPALLARLRAQTGQAA